MLVLTRLEGESITIGDGVTVKILEQRGRRTKLGIEAPDDVTVHRTEVTRRHDFRDRCAKGKPAAIPALAVASNANPIDGQ